MNLDHLLLVLAIVTGVMQASLDKRGIGNIDYLPTTNKFILYIILSLNVLCNIGLFIVVIWSFFVLPWLATFIVVATTFILFSLAWGTALASLLRTTYWELILSSGLILAMVLKLICSSAVLYLIFRFINA